MFKINGFNSLYNSDGYKVGHQQMLAPNTTRLYGTWIPRSTKHAPKGVDKVLSFGQQLVVKWLHYEFEENFFELNREEALQFTKDMSLYLGMEYNGKHFEDLYDLGYLPIKIQALTEGIETNPNIPHMTFINTVDGFAWLTLYLETFISSLAWKAPTSASIALEYRRNVEEWVKKTDPENAFLIPFLCHDFSARGLDPYSQIASGLGHATSFLGSDTLPVIPASRFFYNENKDFMPIYSVNASEHSVSTTKIFTVGEKQMLSDWMKLFPKGILSVVSDTFDLWKLITEYLPALKEEILSREGKLVIRPDSGDPVDILCGLENVMEDNEENVGFGGYYIWDKNRPDSNYPIYVNEAEAKGVIELLWDIFGGTVNEQGYKVLDSHIGAIYGDSITLDRQVEIYKRLEAKGFAVTNIVLGIGSYTYQMNTRDTLGFAAKGAWFEIGEFDDDTHPTQDNGKYIKKGYDIYKDPITDDGTKKSLKGFQYVYKDENGEYQVESQVDERKAYHNSNELRVIYDNGYFLNETTLTEIRERINGII